MAAKKQSINLPELLEFQEAIKNTLAGLDEGKKLFKEGLIFGYLSHEIKEIPSNEFISSTGVFPKIFTNIVETIEKYNKDEKNKSKIELDVDIVSTMLPRHFWNFPRRIQERGFVEEKPADIKVDLTISLPFVDEYRIWLSKLILEHPNTSIKRTTLIGADMNVLVDYSENSNSALYKVQIFDIKRLEKDLNSYINQPPTTIKVNDKDLNDSHINSFSLFDSEDKINFMSIRKHGDYSIYPFMEESNTHSLNLYKYFIDNLHSKKGNIPEANFCFVSKTSNDLSIKENAVKPILVREIASINPDFIILNFRPNDGEPVYTALLIGKINLFEGYVKLNYYDSKVQGKETFEKYMKVYNLIKENSYNYEFTRGDLAKSTESNQNKKEVNNSSTTNNDL